MTKTADILALMRRNPRGVRFADLAKVCEECFGVARHKSSSHCIYQTAWQGDPRVNIQNSKGMAKAYQVRQVLHAIERLNADKDING